MAECVCPGWSTDVCTRTVPPPIHWSRQSEVAKHETFTRTFSLQKVPDDRLRLAIWETFTLLVLCKLNGKVPNGCCHHKIPGEKRGAGCRICPVHFLPVESLELPRHVSQSVVRVKSWSSLKPGWVSGGRLVGCLGRNSSISSKCRWFLKVNIL